MFTLILSTKGILQVGEVVKKIRDFYVMTFSNVNMILSHAIRRLNSPITVLNLNYPDNLVHTAHHGIYHLAFNG